MSAPTILICEDDPDGRHSVQEAIEDAGMETVAVETAAQCIEAFRDGAFNAVLSDLVLPDRDGIAVLTELLRIDARVPVLIMTAYGSVESSVKALKAGAYDYISKPLDLDDIQAKVRRAVETHWLRTRVEHLNEGVRHQFSATSIVAASPSMKEVIRQIGSLAATSVTVMIRGESGTGKELVARALHVDGSRAGAPFVAVNCGAFTETLLESELFGHEKGAFTGAISRHKGAFERANGGTLFLDEIGDAPKSVQVKLLRVLEQREVIRVGGQEPFFVDVRLISATNQDLEALVEEREFREDLLYRLNVVPLTVPPLRERKEDIRPLAERFIAQAASEHGRHIAEVEPDFYAALAERPWPGNVRQLRNAIESAVVMTPRPVLTRQSIDPTAARAENKTDSARFAIPAHMTWLDIEREALLQTLSRFNGNRTMAADALQISRRTIQRKIKEHNLPF